LVEPLIETLFKTAAARCQQKNAVRINFLTKFINNGFAPAHGDLISASNVVARMPLSNAGDRQ
jgi:hypothetical protein